MTRTVLGIDTGGTFTDFVAITDERVTVHKLPSTPEDPAAAAAEGAALVPLGEDDAVAHGTTVATNALLERRGARTALVTTEGFEDVLEIGRQARRDLYDLAYRAPSPLVPRELRLGLAERGRRRQCLAGAFTRRDRRHRGPGAGARARGRGDQPAVCVPPSRARAHALRSAGRRRPVRHDVERGVARVPGVRAHQRRRRERLRRPTHVGLPRPAARAPRTAHARDAVLGRRHLRGPGAASTCAHGPQRPGRRRHRRRVRRGRRRLRRHHHAGHGGTSTDVSLCPGRVQAATGFEVDGLPVGVPVIDIRTVGAGGGSIARLDDGGALRVGPESAGASPGPACYGLGDLPTVTDANLLLGRMAAERFLDGRVAIDPRRSREAIERLAAGMGTDSRQAALGIVRIANAVMERALRTVSLERGHDPRDFTLVAFGGAGRSTRASSRRAWASSACSSRATRESSRPWASPLPRSSRTTRAR